MAVARAFLLSPENPRETSRQTSRAAAQSKYVPPLQTAIALRDQGSLPASTPPRTQDLPPCGGAQLNPPTPAPDACRPRRTTPSPVLDQPMPVRVSASDRTETTSVLLRKDTARELAAKAASRAARHVGPEFAMMTCGGRRACLTSVGDPKRPAVAGRCRDWWCSPPLYPPTARFILVGGLAVFALAALRFCTPTTRANLDQNHNGIPISSNGPLKWVVTAPQRRSPSGAFAICTQAVPGSSGMSRPAVRPAVGPSPP